MALKKAEIYSSLKRGKDGTRVRGFRFRLKGPNGEKVGVSQHYTRKEKAEQTLIRLFGDWRVIDLTQKK